MSDKTRYQQAFELHYNALLGMLRHLIARFADESVEIAARGVALFAPLPNAINMYNVATKDLGYSSLAAFAFAMTLEIVVFLLVEICLRMWDGYLAKPARYGYPFYVAVGVVALAAAVVMVIVYTLETHKIMAALPVISLCAFIGIGLKRWDENHVAGKPSVKSSVKSGVKFDTTDTVNSEDFTTSKVDTRRQTLLKMLEEIDGQGVDSINKSALAKRLAVSRPTIISDIEALKNTGQLTLNGHVRIGK